MPELPPKDLVFRIYRDIRFSSDPTPYKPHFSAAWVRVLDTHSHMHCLANPITCIKYGLDDPQLGSCAWWPNIVVCSLLRLNDFCLQLTHVDSRGPGGKDPTPATMYRSSLVAKVSWGLVCGILKPHLSHS